MNSWNELCYLLWTGKLNNILEQKHFKQCTEIKMLYLANAKQFGFVRKQFNLFWYPRMKQSAIIMTPYWYSTCLFDLYITYGFFKNHFQNEIIKSWMLGSGKIIPKKKSKKIASLQIRLFVYNCVWCDWIMSVNWLSATMLSISDTLQ